MRSENQEVALTVAEYTVGPREQTVGLKRHHKWILLSHATVDLVFIFRPSSWIVLTLAGLKNIELVWRKMNNKSNMAHCYWHLLSCLYISSLHLLVFRLE